MLGFAPGRRQTGSLPSLGLEPLEPRMPLAGVPLVSEFLAINQDGLTDDEGQHSDWIEIYNPTNDVLPLNGWYLTVDPIELAGWQFPSVELAPQQSMIVFASGKDRGNPEKRLHTDFKLPDGEIFLALIHPDGTTVAQSYQLDSNEIADRSFGLDVLGRARPFSTPSPGSRNTIHVERHGLQILNVNSLNPVRDTIERPTISSPLVFHINDGAFAAPLQLHIVADDEFKWMRPGALFDVIDPVIGDNTVTYNMPDLLPGTYRAVLLDPTARRTSIEFRLRAYSAGDANGDYSFNQQDIQIVLEEGKYRSRDTATWSQGDWNGDGVFDSRDLVLAAQSTSYGTEDYRENRLPIPETMPEELQEFFTVFPPYEDDFGHYRSPLEFEDNRRVTTVREWLERRGEILDVWKRELGQWPELLPAPRVDYSPDKDELRGDVLQQPVEVQITRDDRTARGYLLTPQGIQGPVPAAIVVYYEPETSIGRGLPHRDFAIALARRGFVTLAVGMGIDNVYYPSRQEPLMQPLYYLSYITSNLFNAVAALPQVDDSRIAVVGHSYGAKWAMFASIFDDRFATAVWSDAGIVFDETKINVNYWEPWYLGLDPDQERRTLTIPTAANPAYGAYAKLRENGNDLTELLGLMAPRPFLVSGGSEDRVWRWQALNHANEVYRLLGFENLTGLTRRLGHSPTPESNEQIYAFLTHVLMRP